MLHEAPDGVEVDLVVVVDDVPEACDAFPGEVRVRVAEGSGKALGRIADDLESRRHRRRR